MVDAKILKYVRFVKFLNYFVKRFLFLYTLKVILLIFWVIQKNNTFYCIIIKNLLIGEDVLKILKHPLIDIKLTKMRDVNCDHNEFRRNLNEIGSLMVYEIMRNYETKKVTVKTPLNQEFDGDNFNKEIVLVPILRAGLGMTDGLLNLIPESRVGHIGMYRDENTLTPKEYFYKIPNVDKDSLLIVVDPMLATGNSAVDAIRRLKQDGFTNIKLVCLVGVQEGVDNIENNFGKDFEIYLASLDYKLNEHGYIEPGLGDAGDRIFGTK